MRRFFIIASCIAILLSAGHICCLATDTNETGSSGSEDVKYPWFVIWQYIVDHEFFDDEAPGRPFNVSPRLWYVMHHKPAETYNVVIEFVGYQPLTREVMAVFSAEYAAMKGYEDFDTWLEVYEDNEDEIAAYREYAREQQQKWLVETNRPLIEQYLRPEDQYVYNELVTDPTRHVTCNLSSERILEIAATEDCQSVWIDFDRSQLVAGYDLYPPVDIEPADTSVDVTEPPTAEETTMQMPDTDTQETEGQKDASTTDDTHLTDQVIDDQPGKSKGCTGLITLPLLGVVSVLLGGLIRKKKE